MVYIHSFNLHDSYVVDAPMNNTLTFFCIVIIFPYKGIGKKYIMQLISYKDTHKPKNVKEEELVEKQERKGWSCCSANNWRREIE